MVRSAFTIATAAQMEGRGKSYLIERRRLQVVIVVVKVDIFYRIVLLVRPIDLQVVHADVRLVELGVAALVLQDFLRGNLAVVLEILIRDGELAREFINLAPTEAPNYALVHTTTEFRTFLVSSRSMEKTTCCVAAATGGGEWGNASYLCLLQPLVFRNLDSSQQRIV